MKTTDRRFVRTEKTITKAMVELLNKNEIRDIGIDDLIYEADVNRSTLYLHYRSVEDVLRVLEDQLISGIYSSIDSSHNTYEENIDGLLNYIAKNKKLAKAVFSSREKPFLDKFEELVFSNFFVDFKYSKKFKVNENSMLVYAKVDSFDTIIRLWVNDGCKMKKEEVASVLKKINELSQ